MKMQIQSLQGIQKIVTKTKKSKKRGQVELKTNAGGGRRDRARIMDRDESGMPEY